MQGKRTEAKAFLKIIPKYRGTIDTHKLCQAIVLSAKSKANAHEKASEKIDK